MNERIKELLSQAGVHYEVMPSDTVYEKFAELIVQECIRQCKSMEWRGRSDEAVWKSDAADECAESIKQHFGVSE